MFRNRRWIGKGTGQLAATDQKCPKQQESTKKLNCFGSYQQRETAAARNLQKEIKSCQDSLTRSIQYFKFSFTLDTDVSVCRPQNYCHKKEWKAITIKV